MQGLAVFEHYDADFAVSAETLLAQGFEREPPDFYALVAEDPNAPGMLLGMLVYYIIPFTFRARPTLYIKELYVAEGGRGRGTGEALMRAAAKEAVALNCASIKWQVAEWNTHARMFYERLGASADHVWVDYALSEAALRKLAGDS
ncbi:MAG: GNAT family N-acetyltransferase [Gemmatimonadota bacterium]|nr:GNAT family N-acetyltransferase [Gemmatimonadota bacterium]